MFQLKKFMSSESGKVLMSIILGLGIAGLFKMSCDNRSCLVYKGPEFKQDNKTIKYNKKCYKVEENMDSCENHTDKEMVLI